MRDQNIVVYSSGEHTNKYEKVDSRIRPGIHPFYKQEISKLLSDESGKTPYSILKVLNKRLLDRCPGYDQSIPVPKLSQIRNWKTRNAKMAGNEEFDKVSKQIKDLEWNDQLDDKRAFSYGAKIGIGSDSDPFIVCFTSKHLLNNISKYDGHHAVFHIDGTYKLIKNRFPVIVYGRSDMNGQLHLISIAICSDETAATYSHFYK